MTDRSKFVKKRKGLAIPLLQIIKTFFNRALGMHGGAKNGFKDLKFCIFEVLLEKVMPNTAGLTLSNGDCRLEMSGHCKLVEEQVVVEEGFPITTAPIPTPLVSPPDAVAGTAPMTRPTQAHAGFVPVHSSFWLSRNHGNSPDRPPFSFIIPLWYYPWVN